MAEPTFEQNLTRMMAGTLHFLTTLTAAREMFEELLFARRFREGNSRTGGNFICCCELPSDNTRVPGEAASSASSGLPSRRKAIRGKLIVLISY
jgi:hypothetical protein